MSDGRVILPTRRLCKTKYRPDLRTFPPSRGRELHRGFVEDMDFQMPCPEILFPAKI